MIIGILKEPIGEKRVAMLPAQLTSLLQAGVEVLVENEAGVLSFAADADYESAGAKITSRSALIQTADILVGFWGIETSELKQAKPGVIFIGVMQPLFNYSQMQELAALGCTAFSLDMIPRTTRAQSMDVLSSQANIAGYKAVLKAADLLPHYFPMFMTAAGSIPPAKVLVLGAGVAGLQAIATAKRLGAVVEVSDTRPAVKEEVMSLGAKFIEVEGAADASAAGGYAVEQSEEFKQKQKERLAASVAKSDVIIATAQIQGKKAPLLIDEAMLKLMKPGSVVIDLAASTGGNVFGVQQNAINHINGITLYGNSQLAADMPVDASKVYGKNLYNFLQLIVSKEGAIQLNFEDDIVKGCCIVHNGAVVHDRILSLINN
ncbi:NAD(P) transhydrogenase subunit alpha [Sediminibacterium sp. C3]|uniref:NAD(P) transhydrogenase subunit alpha n=1 Tax=Sediminibacterium sp. C3 TaxID=1267211 RepID=UPI00040FE84F|nr:NAD(P) transhydrogenase subunit alpha [Sediminibacterium sp. C3]